MVYLSQQKLGSSQYVNRQVSWFDEASFMTKMASDPGMDVGRWNVMNIILSHENCQICDI